MLALDRVKRVPDAMDRSHDVARERLGERESGAPRRRLPAKPRPGRVRLTPKMVAELLAELPYSWKRLSTGSPRGQAVIQRLRPMPAQTQDAEAGEDKEGRVNQPASSHRKRKLSGESPYLYSSTLGREEGKCILAILHKRGVHLFEIFESLLFPFLI